MIQMFERKRVFINSMIQGRIMTRVAAYWVIYHLVMWHTLFLFHYFAYRVEVVNGAPSVPFAELYGTFCLKYYPIVFSAMACAPLLLGDVLKMTHRIAGPLYRFEKALQAIQAGEEVKAVKLRDHDLLIQFQAEFNRFLDHYNELKRKVAATEPAVPISIPESKLLADIEELRSSIQTATSASVPS